MTPTPEQQAILEAVRADRRSIIIRAYAGTGKTTTLKMVAPLISGPTLALAFNVDRVTDLKAALPPSAVCKTFNGLGHGALSATLRSFPKLDSQKLTKVMKPHTQNMGKDEWNAVRDSVRLAMQAGIVPSEFTHTKGLVPDTPDGWAQACGEDEPLDSRILEIARRCLVDNIKQAFGASPVISFDDQIYLPVLFGGKWPSYPTVLVDEIQDLSPMNHRMLEKVASDRIIGVGDERQAIYAFRGADASSVRKVMDLRSEWIELPLATTFRCPKVVVERQQRHAPGFRAADTAPQGVFKDLTGTPWHWRDISTGAALDAPTAVLCRNNAPLLRMAFKLLRAGVACTVLGRDIAKGLEKLSKEIFGKQGHPVDIGLQLVRSWQDRETQKAEAEGKPAKVAGIVDRAESLAAILEACTTTRDLPARLASIFSGDTAPVVLATGHKAKGMEWHTVVHLDSWRIPSKFALRDGGAALEQEWNLLYVLETRAKHTLIIADGKDYTQNLKQEENINTMIKT